MHPVPGQEHMSLAFKKSFPGLKIVGLPAERCHATKGDLVRVFFQLSDPPPLGWAYIFTSVWRSLAYPRKRPTGVEGDAIWIDCMLEEVATCHWAQLEYAIMQTNAIYLQKAEKQAREEERQSQLSSQLRSKLEALRQTLYPAPPPQVPERSVIARLKRLICGDSKEQPLLPAGGRAAVAPAENMRDYHHGHFDGASLALDDRSLHMDYYDHDQGGTRFCFRYVLSASAAPRLVSGFIHEGSHLDYEIPFGRIPHHVISEAQDWLSSQIAADRNAPIRQRLTELLEYLKEQEKALASSRS